MASVWAKQNLAAATEWARQLADPGERQGGLISIAYEVVRGNPIEAINLAIELPGDRARNDLITHSASEWAAKNPKDAVAWALQVDDETLRQRLLAATATAWAGKEPAAAANMVVASLPPGKPQEDAVMGIVQQWVQRDPRETVAWVLKFPGGPLQDTALEEVVKLWVDRDPVRAGEWVRKLDGDHRDAAVAAYAGKLTLRSLEAAGEWAQSIRDETLRTRAMENVAESWMTSDPAAARRWISSALLPEPTRSRLLAPQSN